MTESEILENIETILYTAEYTNKPTGWRFYTRKGVGSFTGDPVTEYYNETVELLCALHQKLNSKERDFLLKILEPQKPIRFLLSKQPKSYRLVSSYQDFVFMFYIKIKELDKALKLISDSVIVSETKVNVFHVMNEVLTIQPETFDNIKINEILSIVYEFEIFIKNLRDSRVDSQHSIDGVNWTPAYDKTKTADYKESDSGQANACELLLEIIKNRIFKIKKERLSASLLEGINFEINQDQTQLQGFISEFGFDVKLNELISKINEEIYSAKDSFDFTGCIGHIRTLLERLCISTALEIEKKKQIPSTDPLIDKMGKARAYFRYGKVNFLSLEEDNLIDRLFYFLSDKGSHALESEREYARISRNLVIELGLFLVEKLKKYLS